MDKKWKKIIKRDMFFYIGIIYVIILVVLNAWLALTVSVIAAEIFGMYFIIACVCSFITTIIAVMSKQRNVVNVILNLLPLIELFVGLKIMPLFWR